MKDTQTFSYRPQAKQSWPHAYMAFLMSKDENLLLKVAPILLILGSPGAVAAALIPVLGELLDFGGLTMALFVVYKTASAVQKYH